MPRFDPAEFGRQLARLSPQELRHAEEMVAEERKRAEAVLRSTLVPRRAVRQPLAHAAAATSASGGAGRGRGHSDGAAPPAGRRGLAGAARRSPGCIAPTSWSLWCAT